MQLVTETMVLLVLHAHQAQVSRGTRVPPVVNTAHTQLCSHLLTPASHAADLAARAGGLDAEADWAHMLSLGEQQRVAWLRLLLHAPALAFLDEVGCFFSCTLEAG
jgi:ABC-type molybdenum transport system ATPase subunit/photorepair protein PhrA